MRVRTVILGLALVAAPWGVAAGGDARQGGSLFNGKDLSGWEGTMHWSVKDGAITGTTSAEPKLKVNTFLVWKGGTVGDFELKAKFRMEGGNSGIQYRSKQFEKGDYVVAGYQADIDTSGKYIGILYEERGRGILANRGEKVVIDENGKKEIVGSLGSAKELAEGFDPKAWNDYHIIARGNHLQQFLNGKQTIDVVDRQPGKAASEGILALQIHVGPPMEVQFKEIMLKRLSAAPGQK